LKHYISLGAGVVPLSAVKFAPKEEKADQFGNECEGMCGV
jgi:hypothetical protein